ncbi:MAG: YbaB/EbfC family nucleoid-associated protein [Culicoidibacterales bacterium]
MASFAQMLKQAQKLQKDMEVAQAEIATIQVEGAAGGGVVKVILTGDKKVVDITIAPEVMDDVEMLQDLLKIAMNEAVEKATEISESRMGGLTNGMSVPGLF